MRGAKERNKDDKRKEKKSSQVLGSSESALRLNVSFFLDLTLYL